MKESAVIIQTTTNDQNTATKISSGLLESRRAACVQIQAIDSHYHWQGNIVSDKEYILFIKSVKSRALDIINYIKTNHNYSLPEIIQVNVDDCTTEY
ncbi:MAG: divalent-cation tolerance protein CutA, partial [Rickettsiaceae bacterium]|nr:divalent-cation tolerance protein CutA [Rickettsiaceae bacterium]